MGPEISVYKLTKNGDSSYKYVAVRASLKCFFVFKKRLPHTLAFQLLHSSRLDFAKTLWRLRSDYTKTVAVINIPSSVLNRRRIYLQTELQTVFLGECMPTQ